MTRTGNANIEYPQRQALISFTAETVHNSNIPLEEDVVIMDRLQLKNSLLRLDEIAQLQENWNGNGACAFSDNIIRQMTELVSSLSIQPVILPTARDSIQMEYENEAGDYLEFELFENGRLKMFSYTHKGEIGNGDISVSSMDGAVRAFYDRSI